MWSRPRHASLVWRCGSSEIDSGGWADTMYADLHPDRWLCCAVLRRGVFWNPCFVLFCFALLFVSYSDRGILMIVAVCLNCEYFCTQVTKCDVLLWFVRLARLSEFCVNSWFPCLTVTGVTICICMFGWIHA